MGVGDSLEAAYVLHGPVAAGRWHLVADGLLAGQGVSAMDVRVELRWRHAAPDSGVPDGSPSDAGTNDAGADDTVLAGVSHHFVRDAANPYGALAFTADLDGIERIVPRPGDELVLRFTPTTGDPGAVYIPNGDGRNTGGAIPHIDLP